MALNHQVTVLGGMFPSRRDRVIKATTDLLPEHFTDEYRIIFQLVGRFYDMTGEVCNQEHFGDLLRRSKIQPDKLILIESTFDVIQGLEVQDHEWRYAMDALKDLRSEQLTGETIVDAMKILQEGKLVGKEWREGHAAARQAMYEGMGKVERLSSVIAPEGDIRLEAADYFAEYAARKSGKVGAGISCGVPEIDNSTGGCQRGELVFVAAYTGEGKTTFCSQLAWYACTQLGKVVLFATSETLRAQVRKKIYARHSRLPQFRGMLLNSKKMSLATLSPEEELTQKLVVEDFSTNPTYGSLNIMQVPRGATLGYIETRLNRYEQKQPVDLVIIDYLALLKPDRTRQSKREELNDLIQDCKVMAASHADGRGVPIVSPWAMSQSAWKEAIRTGFYELANLADTSEAEKSADQIIAFLRQPDTPRELTAGFLKNRDGEVPGHFSLEVDYATSFLGPKETSTSMSGLLEDSFQ